MNLKGTRFFADSMVVTAKCTKGQAAGEYVCFLQVKSLESVSRTPFLQRRLVEIISHIP